MAVSYENGKVVVKHIPVLSNEQLLRIEKAIEKRTYMDEMIEKMQKEGLLVDPIDIKEFDFTKLKNGNINNDK